MKKIQLSLMKILLLLTLMPLISSCQKKDGWESPIYLNCTINGEYYKDKSPLPLVPVGRPSPRIQYFEEADNIRYYFLSTLIQPVKASTLSKTYTLVFNIVLKRSDAINIGVAYRFNIADLPPYDNSVLESDFCEISSNYYTEYGEGYVQFSGFDSETRWVEGKLVFDFSVPEDADSNNNFIPIHIEGNFRCLIY